MWPPVETVVGSVCLELPFYVAAQVRVFQSLRHSPSHACWLICHGANKFQAVSIEQFFGLPFMFANSIHHFSGATWINLFEPVGPKKLRSFGVGDIAWTGRRVDCLPFVVECLMIVQAKQAVGDNLSRF
jgi:hypothetical protein